MIFLFISYMKWSFLTVIAISLLVVVLVDYSYPKIAHLIFEQKDWTGIQQNQYENLCADLSEWKWKFKMVYEKLCDVRKKRTKMVIQTYYVNQ